MTLGGVFFIVLTVLYCIFLCLEYFEKRNYEKRLEEAEYLINDLIRFMGRSNFDSFCDFCGGRYKWYVFHPTSENKFKNKSIEKEK